jgi:hypothetical protein
VIAIDREGTDKKKKGRRPRLRRTRQEERGKKDKETRTRQR